MLGYVGKEAVVLSRKYCPHIKPVPEGQYPLREEGR
jgi:hypothetical protein